MAAIAALAYTRINGRSLEGSPGTNETVYDIQFGNGTDTYPTGGLTISGGLVGLPNSLARVMVIDVPVAGGYFARYNRTTLKLQLLDNTGAEISSAATPNSLFRVIMQGH